MPRPAGARECQKWYRIPIERRRTVEGARVYVGVRRPRIHIRHWGAAPECGQNVYIMNPVLCMHAISRVWVTRIFACMISQNSSVTHFRIDPPKRGSGMGRVGGVAVRGVPRYSEGSMLVMSAVYPRSPTCWSLLAAKLHGTHCRP